MGSKAELLVTPDGRYFVIRGRLWRMANPSLTATTREQLVRELMEGRRAVRTARSETELRHARSLVDVAKRALGERGPVWWTDGDPDYNRHKVKNTPYADWYQAQPSR